MYMYKKKEKRKRIDCKDYDKLTQQEHTVIVCNALVNGLPILVHTSG